MANIIPALIKYLPDIVDKGFCDESFIEKGFVNQSKYVQLDFTNAGMVRVMEIALSGLSDYYKVNHTGIVNNTYANNNSLNGAGSRDGLQRGDVRSAWTDYKLKHLRGIQLPIDWVDNEEAGGRLIAVTLDEFIRTQYVPEFDTIGFSTLAGRTYETYGNRVKADYSPAGNPNTVIQGIDDGVTFLKQRGVHSSDMVIYCDPITMAIIKRTTELTHFTTPADFHNGVSFELMAYNGMPIIEVPSDRFYTDAVTAVDGVQPQATSVRINFMIVDRKCMVPVKKLDWSQIFDNNSGVTNFKGWLVDFLAYYDFIVPNKKVAGVYCSLAMDNATTPLTNLLSLGLVAGDTTGTTAVAALDTVPTSKAGTLVYSTTAFVVGQKYTIGTGNTAVPVSSETNWYAQFTPTATSNVYFALIDVYGQCIAVSNLVATVPTAQ
jgi:hypothetical protein